MNTGELLNSSRAIPKAKKLKLWGKQKLRAQRQEKEHPPACAAAWNSSPTVG